MKEGLKIHRDESDRFKKEEKKEYSTRTEEQIRLIVFYLEINYAVRRADASIVARSRLATFIKTNTLEIRVFGHRGKPAGESVVSWAWNPFDD
jgi:hypothetical protein